MSDQIHKIPDQPEAPPRISGWKRFRRVFFGRPMVILGSVIIAIMLITAILAPLLAPYDPAAINLRDTLQGPSAAHWLGTDSMGRDTLSRLIYGARTSLIVGLVSIFFASSIGIVFGVLAGYYGGRVEAVIMRVVDSLMVFPMILLALVIAALLGGGMKNVIIALSISLIPQYARLMHGQVLSIKESDYIVAARSLGATDLRILAKHLFGNAFPPLIIQMTLRIGRTILSEASLSFLGVGITEPTASWGGMASAGRTYLETLPVLSLAPGVAIMLVVFAFNMVGDGLRDALDPRLRGKL